jgi:hypothetical protein
MEGQDMDPTLRTILVVVVVVIGIIVIIAALDRADAIYAAGLLPRR